MPAKVPDQKTTARYQRHLSRLRRLQEAGTCDIYYGDESGFCLSPCLPYLWQKKGQRIGLPAHAHGKRVNAFSMARRDGQVQTLFVEGRFTAEHVIAGVERLLLPGVRKPSVLILDNASVHQNALVREKRKAWKAKNLRVVFLPPYSPHLNPVEGLWHQVKYRWLEPAAYETYQALCQALDQIFDQIGAKYPFSFA